MTNLNPFCIIKHIGLFKGHPSNHCALLVLNIGLSLVLVSSHDKISMCVRLHMALLPLCRAVGDGWRLARAGGN